MELTGTLNHISGFSVVDPSYNLPDCSSALKVVFPSGAPGGSSLCRVGSFNEFNLNLLYNLTPNLALRAAVTNLFNRSAPIDAFASGSTGGGVGSGGAHYDPSLHQSGAVGRFTTLALSYKF
jgi:iron complex outermembrane receptor protein